MNQKAPIGLPCNRDLSRGRPLYSMIQRLSIEYKPQTNLFPGCETVVFSH